VIEENSEFNESGNGYASDTPVAGRKKKQNNETFGDAAG
jgi:hypothetical protein